MNVCNAGNLPVSNCCSYEEFPVRELSFDLTLTSCLVEP